MRCASSSTRWHIVSGEGLFGTYSPAGSAIDVADFGDDYFLMDSWRRQITMPIVAWGGVGCPISLRSFSRAGAC
jgi:hypothetical protein